MKETLTKNLGGSASDIAETIEHFKNDEILDTFNVDNENLESPPVQRKAFRQQRSLRLPPANTAPAAPEDDNESSAGDFGSRRRNLKFRTLGTNGDGHGKPLGDREIMLKKMRASTSDLAGDQDHDESLDDVGNAGLFDRFSAARKTLSR